MYVPYFDPRDPRYAPPSIETEYRPPPSFGQPHAAAATTAPEPVVKVDYSRSAEVRRKRPTERHVPEEEEEDEGDEGDDASHPRPLVEDEEEEQDDDDDDDEEDDRAAEPAVVTAISPNNDARLKTYIKPRKTATQEVMDRRMRKNAQSRARAAKLRQRVANIGARPTQARSEDERILWSLYEERRRRKNERSRDRALEKKEAIDRILTKQEKKRTRIEIQFLETALSAKKRKNEGDRLRRQRLKELGLSTKGMGLKPGITARGPLPPHYHHAPPGIMHDPMRPPMVHSHYPPPPYGYDPRYYGIPPPPPPPGEIPMSPLPTHPHHHQFHHPGYHHQPYGPTSPVAYGTPGRKGGKNGAPAPYFPAATSFEVPGRGPTSSSSPRGSSPSTYAYQSYAPSNEHAPNTVASSPEQRTVEHRKHADGSTSIQIGGSMSQSSGANGGGVDSPVSPGTEKNTESV
jgi:hypothetical protein